MQGLKFPMQQPLPVTSMYAVTSLTLSPPRVSLWRVKWSGIRQSKIYKWPLVVKGLRQIVFLTLSPPRVSLWRVKSSGVRQSKIYKWPLMVKGLTMQNPLSRLWSWKVLTKVANQRQGVYLTIIRWRQSEYSPIFTSLWRIIVLV